MNKKPALIAAAAVTLTMTAVPATANAGDYGKEKFGAQLNSSIQPSNSMPAHQCDDSDPATMCSFVMNEAYGRPNGGEMATKRGKLKKVKVVSGSSGQFRLQLVKAKYKNGAWESKVKRNGPIIQLQGQSQQNWDTDTYKVEKFTVNMKIKKGWRLAMQAQSTSAVRCSSGGDNTLIFTPQLHKGWGWQQATDDDGCYPLMEGVIKYKK